MTLDRSQLDALEKATEAARKNYEAQRRDYRLGLVTNLDALQALTAFRKTSARSTARATPPNLTTCACRRRAPAAPTRPEDAAP